MWQEIKFNLAQPIKGYNGLCKCEIWQLDELQVWCDQVSDSTYLPILWLFSAVCHLAPQESLLRGPRMITALP